MFTPVIIRRELFKLFYTTDLFNLNEKADSAEALSAILSLLHASMCSKNFLNSQIKRNVDEMCDESCASETGEKCFVHQIFHIEMITKKKCRCGKRFIDEKVGVNNTQIIVATKSILA